MPRRTFKGLGRQHRGAGTEVENAVGHGAVSSTDPLACRRVRLALPSGPDHGPARALKTSCKTPGGPDFGRGMIGKTAGGNQPWKPIGPGVPHAEVPLAGAGGFATGTELETSVIRGRDRLIGRLFRRLALVPQVVAEEVADD